MKAYSLIIAFSVFTFCCFSQPNLNDERDSRLGFQIGYSDLNSTHFAAEGGLNYMWAFVKRSVGKNKEIVSKVQSIGLFVSYNPVWSGAKSYSGWKMGAIYNFPFPFKGLAPIKIRPSLELLNNEFRLGGDVGISFLGFYFYYGYCKYLNKQVSVVIPENRIGIAFVFNLAPIKVQLKDYKFY